jgi:quercetin dioxygenase-like cupin family protein
MGPDPLVAVYYDVWRRPATPLRFIAGRRHVVQIGDSFENPVTRECFVWRATTASTGGKYCEFDLHLGPGAKLAAPHRHPGQLETFSLVSGSLEMKVAGRRRTVTAGEDVAVPAGTAHAWGNTGDEAAHVVVRLTPSYLIEEYFEAFCRIASNGQANRSGLPKNPLQFAVLIDRHRAEFALPSPLAQAVAGPALRALAVIGRAAGFRPDGTQAHADRG